MRRGKGKRGEGKHMRRGMEEEVMGQGSPRPHAALAIPAYCCLFPPTSPSLLPLLSRLPRRFEGDHNSSRPEFFYSSVAVFFHNTLQVRGRKLKEV